MGKDPAERPGRAPTPAARTDADKRPRLLDVAVALFVVGAVVIRNPRFLTAPRIWAEEGSVYIQAFLDHGLAGSILTPHLGYYSLVPNLAAAASVSALGLKWAAFGTTYFSLAVMLPCVLAPLYLPSHYWRNDLARFTLPIAGVLMSGAEIWLNTVNVQFYLGLFACYLLLTDFSRLSARLHRFSTGVLTAAALTGAAAAALFPFFLHKAYLARNIPSLPPAARRRQKTACAVVGGGLSFSWPHSRSAGRTAFPDWRPRVL